MHTTSFQFLLVICKIPLQTKTNSVPSGTWSCAIVSAACYNCSNWTELSVQYLWSSEFWTPYHLMQGVTYAAPRHVRIISASFPKPSEDAHVPAFFFVTVVQCLRSDSCHCWHSYSFFLLTYFLLVDIISSSITFNLHSAPQSDSASATH